MNKDASTLSSPGDLETEVAVGPLGSFHATAGCQALGCCGAGVCAGGGLLAGSTQRCQSNCPWDLARPGPGAGEGAVASLRTHRVRSPHPSSTLPSPGEWKVRWDVPPPPGSQASHPQPPSHLLWGQPCTPAPQERRLLPTLDSCFSQPLGKTQSRLIKWLYSPSEDPCAWRLPGWACWWPEHP